jgi:hypothetical protein
VKKRYSGIKCIEIRFVERDLQQPMGVLFQTYKAMPVDVAL